MLCAGRGVVRPGAMVMDQEADLRIRRSRERLEDETGFFWCLLHRLGRRRREDCGMREF